MSRPELHSHDGVGWYQYSSFSGPGKPMSEVRSYVNSDGGEEEIPSPSPANVCPACGAVGETPTSSALAALTGVDDEMPPPPRPLPDAVAQMAAACRFAPARFAPANGEYAIALGVAQYRLGKFQKEEYRNALATLTKCDQYHATTLAFLAMAQHQLGQQEQAEATLARLREALKTPTWAKNAEAQGFLREAEALAYPES